MILGGTKFSGLELVKKFAGKKQFEVHIASRRDPGSYLNYYFINRKNEDELKMLIKENDFEIIVDFISYSLPDAEKLINAIRSKHDYNPYLITISSTYVYGNPNEVVVDAIYNESSFDPLSFEHSHMDRPEIDYFLGKRSMESYISKHYENYALIRFPVILGENDYTGKTGYFFDIVNANRKISLDPECGPSNFLFSIEAAESLYQIIKNKITGPLNCCLDDRLNQIDILTLYCKFFERSVDQVIDENLPFVKSPFYYRKAFLIDNERQKKLIHMNVTFEEALNRELTKITAY